MILGLVMWPFVTVTCNITLNSNPSFSKLKINWKENKNKKKKINLSPLSMILTLWWIPIVWGEAYKAQDSSIVEEISYYRKYWNSSFYRVQEKCGKEISNGNYQEKKRGCWDFFKRQYLNMVIKESIKKENKESWSRSNSSESLFKKMLQDYRK